MGMINVQNIQPGMILAADVNDPSGRILMKSGQEVMQKHLRIFQMWGIMEVNIVGAEQEDIMAKAVAQIDPEVLLEAQVKARGIFRHADLEHPAIKELYKIATLRFARQSNGGIHG